jgi:hypothetical protein
MKKVESKTKYKAEDGREFTDPKACERYEKLAAARREYRSACQEFSKVAAEFCKTADGVTFRFDFWHGYYFITPGHYSLPGLRRIDFSWAHHWTLDAIPPDDNGTDVVLVDISDNKHTYGERFPIRELYYEEAKAKVALIAAQEKWLAERAAEVAEDKANLA